MSTNGSYRSISSVWTGRDVGLIEEMLQFYPVIPRIRFSMLRTMRADFGTVQIAMSFRWTLTLGTSLTLLQIIAKCLV